MATHLLAHKFAPTALGMVEKVLTARYSKDIYRQRTMASPQANEDYMPAASKHTTLTKLERKLLMSSVMVTHAFCMPAISCASRFGATSNLASQMVALALGKADTPRMQQQS